MAYAYSSRYNENVHKTRRGQIALSTVILIGGVSIMIGVGIMVLVSSFLNSSYGYQAAERALAVAHSGSNDALLRLLRNKDLSGTYTITLKDGTASVTVTQGSGSATIVSQAVVSGYKRKVRTMVSINPVTGEVSLLSSSIAL
jgi:hypothetical protein